MKAALFIATGMAIIATAVYFWKFKKRDTEINYLAKENERHHLTNVFSRAKEVAVGN